MRYCATIRDRGHVGAGRLGRPVAYDELNYYFPELACGARTFRCRREELPLAGS
jgi:hypothetical protein